MNQTSEILKKCTTLLSAYNTGLLGDTSFPEEQHPEFASFEEQLIYFTLPMALNYRRSSKQLWNAALATISDPQTREVFELQKVSTMPLSELREKLSKHKLALLLETSSRNWQKISTTFVNNFGSISSFIAQSHETFAWVRQEVQKKHKREFPFLSGPKIFNYWNLILMKYCSIHYSDKHLIDIAPDVHVIRSSVRIGVISEMQAQTLPRQAISDIWRNHLQESDIAPIDMHPPLWFWSKNGYKFSI